MMKFLGNKNFRFNIPDLSGKQLFTIISIIVCFFISAVMYSQVVDLPFKIPKELIISKELVLEAGILASSFYMIILSTMAYIVNSQLVVNEFIAETPLGNSDMFSSVVNVLTLFAALGCAYRIVQHYLNTDKLSGVASVGGFFTYIPILILFVFSDNIVEFMVSSNEKINQNQISNISQTLINSSIDDAKKDEKKLKDFLETLNPDGKKLDTIDELILEIKSMYYTSKHEIISSIKQTIMGLFGVALISILAVPTLIMIVMVKVLLTIGLIGAKIVFLLAFIPGFEQTWKTYMLNILNILLWIPIFNVLIAFIILIITTMIGDDKDLMSNGSVIWLMIVAYILTSQVVSLTTSAAQIIVNGSGAGMAGALGGLGNMNAVNTVSSAVKEGTNLLIKNLKPPTPNPPTPNPPTPK